MGAHRKEVSIVFSLLLHAGLLLLLASLSAYTMQNTIPYGFFKTVVPAA